MTDIPLNQLAFFLRGATFESPALMIVNDHKTIVPVQADVTPLRNTIGANIDSDYVTGWLLRNLYSHRPVLDTLPVHARNYRLWAYNLNNLENSSGDAANFPRPYPVARVAQELKVTLLSTATIQSWATDLIMLADDPRLAIAAATSSIINSAHGKSIAG